MNKTASFARHQAVGVYRRWDPPDFGAPRPPVVVEPEPVPEPAQEPMPEPAVAPPPVVEELPEPEPPEVEEEVESETEAEAEAEIEDEDEFETGPLVLLPTAEEVEQIHEEARRSGFDEGLEEGYKKGYSEGKEAGFEEGREAGFSEGKDAAENEARQLHELLMQLEQAVTKLDGEIAEELMACAIELSRKIIQHTLAVEPEAVVSAIRAVLQTLPQSRAQIHLNPEDVALARSHLAEVLDQAGHVLIEDESVSRGGCRVETPGAQIDATIETRWRRTIESLGREHSPWIASGERRTKSRRMSDGTKPLVKEPPAPAAPKEPPVPPPKRSSK